MHYPERDGSVAFECDAGPEEGQPADELLRAVERVDDPADAGVGLFGLTLFGEEPGAGYNTAEHPPDQKLRLAVGSRHRRVVGFQLDRAAAPEAPPLQPPGGLG